MTNGRCVCIIDDDAGIRKSLSGLLRSFDWEVSTFSSGEEFLASGASEDCECVVSDYQMPNGMSGLDLAGRLTAQRSPFPMILISAYLNAETEQIAKAAGVHCVLRKPFRGEELVACIERAVKRADLS